MQKPFKIECEIYHIETILTALQKELAKQPEGTTGRMFLEEALQAVKAFTTNR